jgi:branched-chain amino acid transport system substrate-binding protein
MAWIATGGPTHAVEGPLQVGLILSEGADTDALAAGAREAVEEVNASGGIGGRPLQLLEAEPGHPWRGGAGRLAELVFRNRLIAVLGAADDGTAHSVAQIATRRRIPLVTLSPEASLTRAMDPWVLRAVPDDEAQAVALLEWARADGAGERLGLAVPSGRAGRERARSLGRAAAATGSRVVCVMQAAPGAPGAPSGCDAASYDVLMLWLDAGPGLELLASLDAARLPERILGSTRLDDEKVRRTLAGDDAAVRLAIPLLRPATDEPGSAALAERLGYDLVHAVAASAATAGPDPLAVRDALRESALAAGRSGSLEFDEQGNRRGELRVGVWRRGGWAPARAPLRGRIQ